MGSNNDNGPMANSGSTPVGGGLSQRGQPAFRDETNDPSFLVDIEQLKVVKLSQKRLLDLAKLAAIGELVSGAAHEITNPLATVIGYSELLLKQGLDPVSRERLQIMQDQAKRACRLVDNLVFFTQHYSTVKTWMDVRDPLKRVFRLRSYKLKVNHIEVVKEFSGELPMIPANDRQLAQVYLNLVTNAEHAMSNTGNGGRLTVKAELKGDHIRLTFQDNGPGIAPEHMDCIFDPFFTTEPQTQSAGSGLNISRTIVEEHGGSIWVDNRPGQGAAFIVALPLVTGPARETAHTSTVQNSG